MQLKLLYRKEGAGSVWICCYEQPYSFAVTSKRLQPVGSLSDLLRDFKKFTSQRITKAIEENDKESRKRWLMWLLTSKKATEGKAISFRFWQPDNHAEICFKLPFMWQKLTYIHNNPVRARLVDKAEEYKWSSAGDYFYGKQMGRVKIEWLDAMVVTV